MKSNQYKAGKLSKDGSTSN